MKGLITRYYVIYVLLLALFASIHFLMPQIELNPDNAYIVSVVCIFFLFTIPATLKLFSVKTKGNKKLKTREEKEANYTIWAQIQMYMVALPAVVSAISYGFLKDKSTIFCYLIAFIALIMCKPSKEKMEDCCRDTDEI
jgi:uncharacterized membrane protein YbhN (UPF0104 family)